MVLREEGVVRIYDIFFDYDVLLVTDAFFRKIIAGPEFQRADEHRGVPLICCGKYVRRAREGARHRATSRCSAAAYECGVPIYTSSPGD